MDARRVDLKEGMMIMLEDSLSADRKNEIEEHITAITIYANVQKVQHTLLVPVNTSPLLLLLTANMIFNVGRQCSKNFTTEKAWKFIKSIPQISELLDIGGLIPGGIYCCNVAWQNFAQEIFGWITFIMIKDEFNRETLSFLEKWKLIRKATQLRNRNNNFVKKLTETRKRMSPSEQKIFDECLKTLADKRAISLQSREAMSGIQDLLKPYEIIF